MSSARPAWARWAPWLLPAAVGAAYANSFTGQFVFDDYRFLTPLHDRVPWAAWLLQTARPIVYLSFALNYAAHGLDVRGYHAVNIALHAAAALALYGVLRRLFRRAAVSSPDGAAFAAALVWAVHPVQTESVTYLVQRAEVLSGLCALLAVYAALRALEGRHARRWEHAAAFACAAAMVSKPVAVVVPFAIALIDRAAVFPAWAEAFRRRRRFYLELAATWLVLAAVLALGRRDFQDSAGAGANVPAWWRYAATQPGVILHYLRLAFWPHPLVLDYEWPLAASLRDAMVPAALVAALVWATARVWRLRPVLGLAGAWWFLMLAPTSSLLPITDVAVEHRMYLPLAAAAAAVAAGGVAALRRARLSLAGPALVAVMALALGLRTAARNEDYRTPARLWRSVLAYRPNNVRAHYNFGVVLMAYGATDAGMRHLRQAMALEGLRPDDPSYLLLNPRDTLPSRAAGPSPVVGDVHGAFGWMLARQGRAAEALPHLEAAARMNPEKPETHGNLGNGLVLAGRFSDAEAEYRRALELRPQYAEAANGLGVALLRQGRAEESAEWFRRALALDPDDAQARANLAVAERRLGRPSVAGVELDGDEHRQR